MIGIEDPVCEFGGVGVELAVEGCGVGAPGESGGAGDVFVAVGKGVVEGAGFGGSCGGRGGEGGCLGWVGVGVWLWLVGEAGDADIAVWRWWFGILVEAVFPHEFVRYRCGGLEGVWRQLFRRGHAAVVVLVRFPWDVVGGMGTEW